MTGKISKSMYFSIFKCFSKSHEPFCSVYFAVITLTTAGLGDFVPTTDANKIICSIFIYFGVACIGLLLGTYIANMQDDRAYLSAKKKQIESCPNCARLLSIKEAAEQQRLNDRVSAASQASHRSTLSRDPIHLSLRNINQPEIHSAVYVPRHHHNRTDDSHSRPSEVSAAESPLNGPKVGDHMPPISEQSTVDVYPVESGERSAVPPPPPPVSAYSSMSPTSANRNVLGSPMTRDILGRQKHTRHHSFDISNMAWNPRTRKYSEDLPSAALTPPQMNEKLLLNPPLSAPGQPQSSTKADSLRGSAYVYDEYGSDDSSDDYSDDTSETASTIDEIVDEKLTRIKAAKYVFLTLRKALVNSMVIIAVGCIGFVLTEEFSIVDGWYFVSCDLGVGCASVSDKAVRRLTFWLRTLPSLP